MKRIYSELSRIQQELKAPKNLYNSFGKYKYRNAEGILEAVKPMLNGLSLIINDDLQYIGNRYYIKATVTLTDGEESVSAVAYAREDETKKGMDGCQITGACSSYARKYALNALLMIDDSKDSDDDSLSPKNPKNQEEFSNSPINENPQISKADKIPAKDQINTVGNYLINEITAMQEAAGLKTYQEMKERFNGYVGSLIKSGALPEIDWKNITQEQARNVVTAVRRTFFNGDAA